ncbi:hypothetical protein ILYODFUR_020508 [Ilyodon furcidens]|uniref:Uncharacterized protein n=1 Tax=Ilyodon furcidens TaxID=33524 RepID=A0ABV0SZU2_9TELE
MSDEENLIVPPFLEDVRVQFVAEKVCFLLQLQRQIWERSAANGEFQALLKDFFQKETVIYFSSSSKHCVLASNEVPPVASQDRQIYILKKRTTAINSENYRGLLTFGVLSASPLMQLSCVIQQVIAL